MFMIRLDGGGAGCCCWGRSGKRRKKGYVGWCQEEEEEELMTFPRIFSVFLRLRVDPGWDKMLKNARLF
ncbi:hypothetical protein Pmani_012234 [Petrolisthes manimaculis]|uniref:Uncharacterized protein n=1 Tax=Petrolisthes manimaculis TaxID=1843537 RepID=A0AAE1PZD4_9EUCA|nr:hypothetical protein Pmani_012234 [Petrolisthes manimaculis]